MTETLRTKQQLLDQFLDNETQNITPEMIRDFVISVLGVGTGEADSGATPQNIDIGSGLERLGNRRFRVLPGGDGTYFFLALGQADIDIEANVNVAIVVNDATVIQPNLIPRRRMYPGAKNEASNFIVVADVYAVAENDIIELTFAETGGANVSNTDYIYVGFRIG